MAAASRGDGWNLQTVWKKQRYLSDCCRCSHTVLCASVSARRTFGGGCAVWNARRMRLRFPSISIFPDASGGFPWRPPICLRLYSGLTKSGQGDEAADSTNSTELIHLVLQHLRESFSWAVWGQRRTGFC